MKNLSLVLLGAAIASLAFLGTSAHGPAPLQGPASLRNGSTLYGLNLVKGSRDPLADSPSSARISIRKTSGNWIEIDFPSSKTGPTWVNLDNVVSYRTSR